LRPSQLTLSLTSHHLWAAQDKIYFEIRSSLFSFPQQGPPRCGEAGRCLLAETAVEVGQHMWAMVIWSVERQLLRLVTPFLLEPGRGLCFYYSCFGIRKEHFFQWNDVCNQISSVLTVSKLHFFLFSGLEPQSLCGLP